MDGWFTQSEHLETHNLFYAAVYGEQDEGLIELNYHVAGEFTVANNRKKGARCQPAFTLYDNHNLIFVDIIEPGIITQEAIDRFRAYNKLDRESVEKYLDRVEFSHPDYGKGGLENFDSCFVMRLEQYETHKAGDPERRRKLENLEQEGCILTISPGDEITTQNRGVHGDDLNNKFEDGIKIPEKTGKYIHLPRQVRQESLAVAICEEMIAGGDLSNGGISLMTNEVGKYFGRELQYDVVDRVLRYLRKIGACRVKQGESAYTFDKYNLDTILDIRNKLSERPIDDVLDENSSVGGNASLTDF